MLPTVLVRFLDESFPSSDVPLPQADHQRVRQLPPRFCRLIQWLALVWLGYLVFLAGLDTWLVLTHPGLVRFPTSYYLAHTLVSGVLVGLTASPNLAHRLGRAFLPLVIGSVSILPVLITFAMLPGLPPAPLSGQRGFLGLRVLPLLGVGLVLVAWYYPWRTVLSYTLGLASLTMVLGGLQPSVFGTIVGVTLVQSLAFLIFGSCISGLAQWLQVQHAEMVRANLQVRHYASTLEQLTVSRERNRVARELHDTIAHTLSSLTIQLEAIKATWRTNPDAAEHVIDEAISMTRQGLTDTRRALTALRVSPFADMGLEQALRTLVEPAAEAARLRPILTFPPVFPLLPPDTEYAVYRIVQEAVTNVTQHAMATTLHVHMMLERDHLTVVIQDDGSGFDTRDAQPEGHFGLLGMHERAVVAGGRLQVTSHPGTGTAVTLTLPR